MSLTLEDVFDKLKKVDEISLLEILDISSEDIVDRFPDKIEDKIDELEIDLDEEKEFNE
jgi:hypothetical protein